MGSVKSIMRIMNVSETSVETVETIEFEFHIVNSTSYINDMYFLNNLDSL